MRWGLVAGGALVAAATLLAVTAIFAPDAANRWTGQDWRLAALAALPILCAVAIIGIFGRVLWRTLDRAEVAESQARRYRMLLRTASDGLHVLDRNGRLVKFSDSFAKSLRRSRDELETAHVTLWDAKFDPDVMADWFTSFQIGDRREFESLHRRSDGTLIDVEVSSSMVRIDGVDLIYCSARDVTRRKQLEGQLAESAAQARLLYDRAPCGYHSLDAKGHYVYVNETELGWLGCNRDELVGKRGLYEFLHDEGRDLFEQSLLCLREGHAVEGVEVDLVGRRGRERRVSVSSTPILDAGGNFVMTSTVMYDITDLHRTRLHLQDMMREQQAMLDNDLIGMVRLRERRILWSNQAMCHLFGYELAEIVGAPTGILYPDADRYEAVGRESESVLRGGGRYRAECELVRRDGERLWVEINGVMLSIERSESMWLFADITSRKHAYEQVQFLAFHDTLTGLPNRMLLSDRLQQAMNTALRRGSLVAVCYVDLDGFKALNDRLGHAAGDLLLSEVAMRLKASTRSVDTVARLGGDEFVVVLSELDDLPACLEILGRIEDAMHANVQLHGFGPAAIAASIGVALFPLDGHMPDALLACADAAMYDAKRAQDGKLRFCSPGAPPTQQGANRADC